MKGYERIAVQIRNLLRSHPRGMTITAISQALGLNRNSVAKYLEVLVTSGQVEKQRVGRAKLFFLSQRVPLSAMLNLTSDMILILDEESRIWYVNDNLLAFDGKAREDLIGKTLEDARIGVLSEPWIRTRVRFPPDEQEERREVSIARGAEVLCFAISLVSTILEGGLRGTTIIMEDITLRKRAEGRQKELLAFLQELIDRVPTPLFYKDLEGHYLGFNLAFEAFSRRPRGEILDRRASDVLPAGLANTFEAMDSLALETGRTQSVESTITDRDGTRRYIIVFKAPFRKPDGSPGGIVGTIFDTTDWKE